MPQHGHEERPRSLLVHGAGSGPWIFDRWADALPAMTLRPVDLQDEVHIQRASMSHYANAIELSADLPCPSLVVSGSDSPVERGSRVAAFYRSDELRFPRLDHWGLVLNPRVRVAIAAHLGFDPG